jgi:hypothetical protein
MPNFAGPGGEGLKTHFVRGQNICVLLHKPACCFGIDALDTYVHVDLLHLLQLLTISYYQDL